MFTFKYEIIDPISSNARRSPAGNEPPVASDFNGSASTEPLSFFLSMPLLPASRINSDNIPEAPRPHLKWTGTSSRGMSFNNRVISRALCMGMPDIRPCPASQTNVRDSAPIPRLLRASLFASFMLPEVIYSLIFQSLPFFSLPLAYGNSPGICSVKYPIPFKSPSV